MKIGNLEIKSRIFLAPMAEVNDITFRLLCKKAGVRYFRFHPLRHAGASIMDQHNVPVGAIQRILGHENRRTTEIYLHSVGEMERHAMSVYECARKKSHTVSHTDDGWQKKRVRRGHLTL